MVFCAEEKCGFVGSYMEFSAELAIIIEHYLTVCEKEFDKEIAKAMFESVLKTAMDIKEAKEKKNGEDET